MSRIARCFDSPDWNRASATQVANAYTIFVKHPKKKKKNTLDLIIEETKILKFVLKN